MEVIPDLVERNLIKNSNFLSAGIPYTVLKNGGQCLIYQLCKLYQLCLAMDILQINGKLLILLLSIKKSNKKEPTNYRPVSLTLSVCKLMESCL